LQGVLLSKLGLDRDTTRVNDDITDAVDALKAASKAPCCHVVTGAEGTSYCGLAESAVLALRGELGESKRSIAILKAADQLSRSQLDYHAHVSQQLSAVLLLAGAPEFANGEHAVAWAEETAKLRKAQEVTP
jgi:hypothetical protein